MADSDTARVTLPEGFQLDNPAAAIPPGFQLDTQRNIPQGFLLDAPTPPGEQPQGTLAKAWFSLLAGTGRSMADIQRTDIGPARNVANNFRRHEAAMRLANNPAFEGNGYEDALRMILGERETSRQNLLHPPVESQAQAAAQLAADAPGNQTVANVAEFAGGSVPFFAAGPAAPLAAAASTSGNVYLQAYEAYRKAGMSDEAATDAAQKIANNAAFISAALFYGQGGAQGSLAQSLTSRFSGRAAQALARTGAAAITGGAVMGADQLQQGVIGKETFNPDAAWTDILKHAGTSAVGGGLAAGVIHGATEAPGIVLRPKADKFTRPRIATPRITAEPAKAKVFSEFGGEMDQAPKAAATEAETKTPEIAKTETATTEIPAGFELDTPPATPVATGGETLREHPATLHAQIVKLHEGKAPAVLFPPGTTIPDWAVKDPRFDTVPTRDGTVLYDTAVWTKDEITRLVDAGQTGTVLGYGTASKPAQATGVVTVRDKQGLELRAVTVDESSAPGVIEAAKRYAGPTDTVQMETPQDVLAKRLNGTGAPTEARTSDAAAQAEAYRQARAAREADAATERQRLAAQADERPVETPPPRDDGIEVTEEHLRQAREAVAQMEGTAEERPPDLLDDVDGVTRGPVKFPADIQDALDASRERVAQSLHQKPWKRLSTAQRHRIDGELRVSTTDGFPADEALTGLGKKHAGMSTDDFANAMLDAGESRLLKQRKGDSRAVRQVAREIAELEARSKQATEEADDPGVEYDAEPIITGSEIPFSLDMGKNPAQSADQYGRKKTETGTNEVETALSAAGYKGRAKIVARPQPTQELHRASPAQYELEQVFRQFERIFNRRIVVFDPQGDTARVHGFTLPSNPKTLYINGRGKINPVAILGHEFLESLKLTHPQIYAQLEQQMLPLLRNVEEYRRRLETARGEQPFQGRTDTALAIKEIIADALGDGLTKPHFWRKLADENPQFFRRIAETFQSFLNWVMDKLRDFGSNRYVTQVHEAETHLRNAIAEFKFREEKAGSGSGPPQMRLEEPSWVEDRKPELDQISQDLYGKPYDELTEYNQGNVQITLESEDAHATVSRRQQRDDAERRDNGDPGTTGQQSHADDRQFATVQSKSVAERIADLRRQWQEGRQPVTRDLINSMVGKLRAQIQRAQLKQRMVALRARMEMLSPLSAAILDTVKLPDGQLNIKAFKALPAQQIKTVFAVTRLENALAHAQSSLANISTVQYPGTELYTLGKLEEWIGEKPSTGTPPHLPEFSLAMEDGKPRATGQKIEASQDISEDVKNSITEYTYDPRSNRTDAETAAGIVQQHGVDAAIALWRRNDDTIPGAVRSKLLGEITRSLAAGEQQARDTGNAEATAQFVRKQADLWNDALKDITNSAQELQALNDLVMVSPDAHVERARREIEGDNADTLKRAKPELDQVVTALDQGRTDGIEAVKQDPAANAAARAAVNDGILKSDETNRAVIMELAGPWAQSEAILNHARDAVRAKANELLNRQPRPPQLSPAQHLRKILDDLAKRAADIYAAHMQGAEPGVTLVDKFKQRLGVAQEHAVKLASSLNKEWESQMAAARKNLDTRLARARVRQERMEREAESNAAVDRALRRQLRDRNLKMGDAIRQAQTDRSATAESLADDIVKASGLTGEKADALRQRVVEAWKKKVTAAQDAALAALEKRSGVKTSRQVRSAFDKLKEMDALAPTDQRFRDVVAAALKLPKLKPEDAAKLRELVRVAQSKPDGFLRQRAMAEAMKFSEKLKGNVKPWDTALGIYYAGILSGVTTYVKIPFENANLFAGQTILNWLTRPGELLHPVEYAKTVLAAYQRGVVKGALQGADTLRSGQMTGVYSGAPKKFSVLEMQPFGARMEPLNFWKWFTRGIAVTHEATFKPAWELKQTLIARELARTEGLRGKALDERVADLLGNTEQAKQNAAAQAWNELSAAGTTPDKLDLKRRTLEIMEQSREERMPGSTAAARDFALRTSYLNDPYGFLGLIAKGVRNVLEQARKEYPVLGTGVKSQIPFTQVVANILNEKLNWSPVGLFRAAVSHKTGKLYGREILDTNERAELYAKAIVGTIAMGVAAEMFGQHIHGNGPANPDQRRQLESTGWIPHSVEWHGRFYSYENTPLAVTLAVVGNYLDWHRYSKGDTSDAATRAAFVTKATANVIISQGMLDSVRRLFEALGTENVNEGAGKIESTLARTASSAVIPNIVQQVDRMFDPTRYDNTGVKALLTSQIPFVRRMNKPVLNVLGEPVEADPFHHWTSSTKPDPLWQILAAKQAWVPVPAKTQYIGDRSKGPDSYRAMTPDEYYQWVAETGPSIRARLMDNLDTLATSDTVTARKLVEKIASEERSKTKPTR